MRKHLLLSALSLLSIFAAHSQATVPYNTCPNVSIAVLRAGTNANTNNPFYLYDVNTTNGSLTQVAGGPFKDPLNNSVNLQFNGIGVNRQDGYIYGLSTEATITTARLLRLDKKYGVTNLGYLPSPTSPLGQIGVVNSAAGDLDAAGNYYYTGATFLATSGQLTGFFLGKVANVQSLSSFNGGLPVTYYQVNLTAGCTAFANALAANLENTIKDFSYNAASNTFFAYLTYKPAGAVNYTGQLVEIKPVAGSNPLRYELVCTPVTNTHTAEVAGTLLDNAGNMLVLLTDGTVGRFTATGQIVYSGNYNQFNNSTGLPNPLRGDMGSCGGQVNAPLPVRLSSFTVGGKDCSNTLRWTTENETAFNRYELEQSTDNQTFSIASTVTARRSLARSSYQVTVPSNGGTTYYRLKMVDDNGSATYSKTVSVGGTCAGKAGFALTPNPASRQLNLQWFGMDANTPVEILVYNSSGSRVARVVKVVPQGSSTLTIDISALPSGAYWIKAVDTKQNNHYDNRFIKQ